MVHRIRKIPVRRHKALGNKRLRWNISQGVSRDRTGGALTVTVQLAVKPLAVVAVTVAVPGMPRKNSPSSPIRRIWGLEEIMVTVSWALSSG